MTRPTRPRPLPPARPRSTGPAAVSPVRREEFIEAPDGHLISQAPGALPPEDTPPPEPGRAVDLGELPVLGDGDQVAAPPTVWVTRRPVDGD